MLVEPNEQSGNRPALHQDAWTTLAINIVGAAAMLMVGLLLGRHLGATGYGAYVFALAWTEILALLAPLGFDKLLVREVAKHRAAKNSPEIWTLMRYAVQVAGAMGLALALVLVGLTVAAGNLLEAGVVPCLLVAAALVPLRAMMFQNRGILLGLNRTAAAAVAAALLQPITLLLLLAIVLLLIPDRFNPVWAVALTGVAAAVAVAVTSLQMFLLIDHRTRTMPCSPGTNPRIGAALPMMFLAVLGIINTRADLIMLGVMDATATVGIYGAALLLAQLVRFGMMAANPALAPIAAKVGAANDRDQLRQSAGYAARMMTGLALLALIGLVLWGRPLLGLYGTQFIQGYPALVILGAAYCVAASMGALETILSMTGHERITGRVGMAATAVNIMLNAALIPLFGLIGAACATGLTTILWAAALSVVARRRLGIDVSIFARATAVVTHP